jgi:CRISPR-associated protein Cmr2
MTTRQTDWTLKLHAFLHDPFEKPLILFSERHTVRAESLTSLLGLQPPTAEARALVRKADHYASAMNRLVVETAQTKHPVDFIKEPIVIHPLSGEDFNLSAMSGPLETLDEDGMNRIVQEAKTAVDDILRGFVATYGHDDQRLFLALWRLLPEQLRRTGSHTARLGHLWSLLPADSRVPDHSIWDHLATTSALVSVLDQPALLLFTVGPVQEFISTARRTQDLWIGSYLLSYLTWQGIRVIAEQLGPDCVLFPSLLGQPLVDQWLQDKYEFDLSPKSDALAQPSFPNRFLALVPAGEAKQLAEESRQALITEWRRVAQAVKELLEERLTDRLQQTDDTWDRLWQAHIDSCFETYWVAVPWGTNYQTIMGNYKRWLGLGNEWHLEHMVHEFEKMRPAYLNPGTLYAALYNLTERALGGRKALRAYTVSIEEGYKCTLCGVREALHPRHAQDYEDIGRFWTAVAERFRGDFHAEGRERLCAVCLVKRLAVDAFFYQKMELDAAFPSTSTMAVEGFRADILSKATTLQHELGTLASALRSVRALVDPGRSRPAPKVLSSARKADLEPLTRMDGRWFFPESYDRQVLAREYGKEIVESENGKTAITEAEGALKKLLQALEERHLPGPSTYYAIVYIDGDQMGEWLSGEHAKVPAIRQVLHPHVRTELQAAWHLMMDMPRPLAPSLHTAVSGALRAFSQEVVRPVVEAHCGILVYSGGDDVIAMFPIRHVLAAVWDLRRLYAGDECEAAGLQEGERFCGRRGFVQRGRDLWMMMGTMASASAGIAIAHHLQPLSQALAAAREAEQAAKHLLGRNAFAVHLLKRSGERLMAGARFTYDQELSTVGVLQPVIAALRGEGSATLSSRLMYQLASERIVGTLKSEAMAAQEAELRRLIGRHVEAKDRKNSEARESLVMQLTSELTQLLRAMRVVHHDLAGMDNLSVRTPFDLFTNLLLLARFIAMEGRV